MMSSIASPYLLLLVALLSAVYCEEAAKKIGGPNKGHVVHGPSYLTNLTKAERQEYYKIFANKELTVQQQEDQRLAFAEKHGFGKAIKDELALRKKNHDLIKMQRPEVIKNLLAAHEELIKIYENKNQTFEKRQVAIAALKDKYKFAPSVLYYISRLITGHEAHQDKNHNQPHK